MKHIPNVLTIIRIILIPVFVWQMLWGNTFYAAVILLFSGVTDFLDGFLARSFNWVTQLGKVLDPIADKLTQVTVCVVLAVKLRGYWIFFMIMLLKELLMLVAGGYLLKKGAVIKGAKWFGKIVTFLFYTIMTLIVFFPNMPSWVIITFLSIMSICAVGAILMYIPDFIQYRKEI